jgi:hypothetical protein
VSERSELTPCNSNSYIIIPVSAYSTTATVGMCDSLQGQLDDSVMVSSTDPAVEGTTVTFHCPAGSIPSGPDSSTCMENGEWKPAPYKVNCSG